MTEPMANPLKFARTVPWKPLATGLLLTLVWLPLVALWIGGQADGSGFRWLGDAAFTGALRRSGLLLASLIATGLFIGLPAGVWIGLHPFRGRSLFLGMQCLPLLLPPFLVSIGLSFLRPWLPYAQQDWVDGLSGCVLTGAQRVIPVALVTAVLTTFRIPPSQRAAAAMAGGEPLLFRRVCRRVFAVVAAATVLASLHVLADPGPAQIMGYHGAASEILIAFSARYDVAQAGQKAMSLTLLLIPILLPVVAILSRSLRNLLTHRDTVGVGPESDAGPSVPGRSGSTALLAWGLTGLLFGPVILGLLRPLLVPTITGVAGQAWKALTSTLGVTLLHAATAGLTATIVGWSAAELAGRSPRHRSVWLWSAFLLLSLPASLYALGVAWLSGQMPLGLEPLVRSRWRVGITLGFCLSPMSVLLGLWSRALLSPRMEEQATLMGVSRGRFAGSVLLPLLLPALIASTLAVAVLAAAEVAPTLLLQPPGETTFPGRLFSMMDNASERLVAALATVYLGGATLAVLGVVLALAQYRRFKGIRP